MPKRKARTEDLDIGEAPTAIDPYNVLEVVKDASPEAIKTAYRKAALKHHPDKVASEDKPAAHIKFQELAFAYAILSDERRRKIYDATGRTEESIDPDNDDFDWTSYFREQYREVVTLEAIEKFSRQYKGSDDEQRSVLQAYTKNKGDMNKLYEEVMLSDIVDDEDRFRAIIDRAIADGEVESFTKYTGESEERRQKRLKRAVKTKEQEAKQAKKAADEIEANGSNESHGVSTNSSANGGGIDGLAALIQKRQATRADDFYSALEAKYAPKTKRGGKKATTDEPPEEAFIKNAKTKISNVEDVEEKRKRKRTKQ